ncbi:MAG: hypothetical protein JOZ99_02270 [Actinobacteria bacterium]|nr:hypothetical protein [Actinomycetota bacterium]
MTGGDTVSAGPARHVRASRSDRLTLGAVALDRPLVVPSDATVQTVAQAMLRGGRSSVVVGSWTIVTERDIARAVALGRSPTTPAAAVARQATPILSQRDGVLDAFATMLREQVTEVVVADDDLQVNGVLSLVHAVELALRHAGSPASLPALREALGLEIRLDDDARPRGG